MYLSVMFSYLSNHCLLWILWILSLYIYCSLRIVFAYEQTDKPSEGKTRQNNFGGRRVKKGTSNTSNG